MAAQPTDQTVEQCGDGIIKSDGPTSRIIKRAFNRESRFKIIIAQAFHIPRGIRGPYKATITTSTATSTQLLLLLVLCYHNQN